MKKILSFLSLAAVMLFAGRTNADVLIKSKTTMDQLLGIGSSESTTSMYIKGDKNRTDTKTTFDSPIFKLSDEDMSSETTEIYRLDKEIKYNLDPRDKSYTEVFIKSLKPGPVGEGESDTPPSSTSGDDIEDYNWTVKSEIADNPEEINGFKSAKGIMNAVGVNKQDPSDSMFVEMTVWKCQDKKSFADIENYGDRFAEVAGFKEEFGFGPSEGYTAGFGAEFEADARKIEEMEGYPVKTVLLIQKSTSGSNEMNQPGISDMMKGLMGGKSSEGQAASRITVLSVTNEVESVENSAIDDSMFEIPEGYNKK